MAEQGLILFAHGARDSRWAEPFEQLLSRVRQREPAIPTALAFLEHMTPDLPTATRQLAESGVARIRIVPLFFGRGGHLREDLPRIVERAREAVPSVSFQIAPAAGEDSAVIDALADFALSGMD